MPYISPARRKAIFGDSTEDYDQTLKTPGELNYFLTVICNEYVQTHGKSYQTFNDVIGVLECCKQEYYRRIVVPYENKKKKSNGDVY